MNRLIILALLLAIAATLGAQTLSPKQQERHDRLTEEEQNAFATRDWKKLRKVNRKLARLLPQYKGFFYCGYGVTLEFYQGNTDAAIKVYKRAVKRYSNSEWGYYRLGSVYYHRGIDLLEQASRLHDNGQYRMMRLKALEYFKQAKPLFEKGLEYAEYNTNEFIEALNHIYYFLDITGDKFDENKRTVLEIPTKLPLHGNSKSEEQ